MRIGIMSEAYPNKRNINNKTDNTYVIINYLNLNSYLRLLARRLGKILSVAASNLLLLDEYRGSYLDVLIYDVAHLFNRISLSGRPWLSTFETTVPFFRKEIEEYLLGGMNLAAVQNKSKLTKGVKACASDSCRALIALSKCSMNIQLALISNFPEYQATIKEKLVQLYPPQELLIEDFEEKRISTEGKLRFMFVGREFYRKGGLEILRCFEKLSLKYQFEVIIISSLQNDIPWLISTEHEMEARALIEKHKGTWLSYYKELENSAVIELMKSSHIGLLPTYSDTFGFSVLEFQACGCPVISTDVRALPEINNNDVGWIIPTGEKTPHHEISNIRGVIDDRLIGNVMENIIFEIFENRYLIKLKANKSINRIAEHHSPADYKRALTALYLT